MKEIVISIFTGGSGNVELINSLAQIKKKTNNLKINLLINGYDDGKSTGFLRDLFPGLLGPSDFRKNCSNLITGYNEENLIFTNILDYRIKDYSEYLTIIKSLKKFANNNLYIINQLNQLKWKKYEELKNKLFAFQNSLNKKNFSKKNFKDMSIGNLLFVGFYLTNKNKFNLAVEKFSNFFNLNETIYNITNGKNLYLCAICENGNVLKDEVSIIENNNKEKIKEIFLIKKKLNYKNILKLNKLKKIQNKLKYLRSIDIKPKLNTDVKQVIKNSDIIIYGTGTQNSSLYPSYLTQDLNNLISKAKAKKIFISNIQKDKDIVKEDVDSIIKKFNFYFGEKKYEDKINKNLINQYFLHKIDEQDANRISSNLYLNDNLKNKKNITRIDWEKSTGIHFSGLVLEKIFNLIGYKKYYLEHKSLQSVSIIMPCLNEARTINKVLQNVTDLQKKQSFFTYELIIVDGGSKDKSLNIAKKYKNIKIYSLKNKQRGECLDLGIKKAKGEIIVIFPTDNEYDSRDIPLLVNEVREKRNKVVYGSRLIKNINPSSYIKKVYGKNLLLYFLSKFGGMSISIFTLLFFNRFLSDPLTTFKCFNSDTIKQIDIKSRGVEYDLEQFAKLSEMKIYVDEYPVRFIARSYKQGKKTNFFDGIKCIYTLIKCKLLN